MRLFILGVLTGFLIGPLLATVIMLWGLWPIAATAQPPKSHCSLERLSCVQSDCRASSVVKLLLGDGE